MDTKNMTLLMGIESYGGTGHFKGQIFIESEKYETLPKEIKNKISYSVDLEKIREEINMEWAKINEAKEREEHVVELTGLFHLAGFDFIHVETIDSEYCSKSCCYKFPWIIVTTPKGRIKLGWRKRVMNLDWSDSDLGIDGEKMFADQNVTKGKSYIHCWGKEKAIEYLKKLNSGE
jgi:hypothetical protein